ncbi:MAG: glycosyl hydrolase [bacterium]
MGTTNMMKRIAILMLALINAAAADELQKNFVTPPAEARPWVYWFPLSGNLTKEGITTDLESMARVGIGGALYMEVSQPGSPNGKADFAGSLWREMVQHACKEASRLGLEINMNNAAGWCGSGGPWITPELSMQKVVWTETLVASGTNISVKLPQPKAGGNYYRDIAVLAMPAPAGEGMKMSDYGAKLTSSGTEIKPGTFKLAKPRDKQTEFVQIAFPQPFTAYTMSASARGIMGELQVSDDGQNFKPVNTFQLKNLQVLDFGPVTARFFRLHVTKSLYPKEDFVEVSVLDLSPRYWVPAIAGKASFLPDKVPPLSATFPSVPASMTIPRDQIKDISAHMDAGGKLTWDAPPGRWLVLRFGHTTTGKDNHPAPAKGGHGLECDKLSKQAAKVAFAGLMGKVISDNKPLVGQGKVLVSTHIDSWESGSQNWTPLMREEFKQRRGYDLLSYLPVFTGRVVENVEVSERFLWDLRQSISDMLVENYAGEFRRLANEQGLRLSIEAYDTPPTDDMKYAGQADEPMAEFWSWAKFNAFYSCIEMASSAHTYGKKILGAEAFTASSTENWRGHPAALKDLGDWAFCEGINRFVVSLFAAQPWTNVAPGMAMGPWGMHYERTQTWWEQSKPWHEYLARCQYLLRQGLFVADVLYLQPEGAPRRFTPPAEAWAAPYLPWAPPYLRGGYNFDGCNSDVLLNRLAVKSGKLVLPDGMNYRVLVVPPMETMTLRVLRKLKELADQGATIIADPKPPVKSPSLADVGAGDETIKTLAVELWSKLVTGKTAPQLLLERGIKPDFSAKPVLRYIHRATADTDLYFVANPKPTAMDAVAEFRITGKQPELWWPDTGRTELAKDYEIKDGITRVPLRLDPSGSVFVIFRQATQTTKGTGKNWIDTTPVQEITGPWDVSFDPKWGGPAQPVTFDKLQDWSKHPDAGIKYYSGHATYRTTFQAKKLKCILDLGKVAIMAEVKLNGKPLGIVWKPPYRVDVSEALKEGENTLEIKVVNLWINRLIGDEQLPEDSERNPGGALLSWPTWLLDGKPSPAGRFTFCTTRVLKKNDSLVESGLIGPVNLETLK